MGGGDGWLVGMRTSVSRTRVFAKCWQLKGKFGPEFMINFEIKRNMFHSKQCKHDENRIKYKEDIIF